jgi:hypothetical protein
LAIGGELVLIALKGKFSQIIPVFMLLSGAFVSKEAQQWRFPGPKQSVELPKGTGNRTREPVLKD